MLGSILKAVAGPLISGGATLIGGMLQNNSAKSQAEKQMDFQENMSNTSYQRQMEDMRLAGLNPILAAKMGGASTPSGSAAPVENVLGPAVNSALAIRMQNAQLSNLAETNEQIRSQTALNAANTAKSVAETNQISKSSQHGFLQKLGGENLTDVVDSLLGRGNLPKASEINKPILDKMRKEAYERVTGFRGNSAKSVSISVSPKGVPVRSDALDWVPSGVLKPPRSN